MTWTQEDKINFIKRRTEYFANEAKEAEQRRQDLTRNACPKCGSRNYLEAIRVEVCYDCGYECTY